MRLQLVAIIGTCSIISCTTFHGTQNMKSGVYTMHATELEKFYSKSAEISRNKSKVIIVFTDTSFLLSSPRNLFPDKEVNIADINNIKILKYTFDIDILTIPFKIRPAVKRFPQQLNPNFSAALYLGKRIDHYSFQQSRESSKQGIVVRSAGFGFGFFTGPGAVTMNPFVTETLINYEYDGFVIASGIAGIYDAKRFNIGIALGFDYLTDKNRKNWIYQGKPWIGILFGLNLN